MKKLLVATSLLGLLLIPSGVFAGPGYGAACGNPCPVASPCSICRVHNCYRTVNNPCLQPDLGVGRVLTHIFAPRCAPKCQPCSVCR